MTTLLSIIGAIISGVGLGTVVADKSVGPALSPG